MAGKRTGAVIVIAGTHSGCGKTVLACGLIAAFRKRGLTVQPFKVGPDYLDPEYLSAAAGRPCANLDLWLMPKEAVSRAVAIRGSDADICVIDGAMGLFDGVGIPNVPVSTAEIAALLGAPVALVTDASAMVESAGALVHGFATFGAPGVAGAIFNRAAGDRHYAVLKQAVEGKPKVRALGWLPSQTEFEIPERPLGLAGADTKRLEQLLPRFAEFVEKTVDVAGLLSIALQAPERPAAPASATAAPRARIGVARDAAFHFYYEDNLEALRRAGADLVFFSPLADAALPKGIGALYLGGGFPETQAARLDANRPMRESIRKAIKAGMPAYAECGGVMYLAGNLVGTGVRAWEMAEAIPGEVRLEPGLRKFGYVEAVAEQDTFLVRKGEKFRGYEFRCGAWTGEGGKSSLYQVRRPGRAETRKDGFGDAGLHASWVHLHFASATAIPERFVKAAEGYAARPVRSTKKAAAVKVKKGARAARGR